jgi:hypothetical protein
MAQLEVRHTIVCIGHDRNIVEKRQLQAGGANPRFAASARTAHWNQ